MAAASTYDALPVRRRSGSLDWGYFPPIHGLATEVVAEILAGLDSSSLSSAILAHPLFRGAFQVYEQRILKDILRRLIPPRLLPLASATYDAASIDYSDGDSVRRLLDRLPAGQAQALSPWPLPLTRRVVAAMERVHLMVQYFTADLAQQAIPRFNRIFEATRPETASPAEELRILRAFYRFQLYCNIFGRKSMDTARKATQPPPDVGWPVQKLGSKSREEMRWELECFFWPWPPWVNEQLACVFEYLEATLSVFFDNVASHDMEWGWRQVDWVEPAVAVPHRRFFLLNGLGLPYQLRHSVEFESWKALLDSADVCWTWRARSPVVTMANSLSKAVAPGIGEHAGDIPIVLGRYDADQLPGLQGPAAWAGMDDTTTLSVTLWRHANLNNTPGHSVFARTNLLLRDAGYVFWDGYLGIAEIVLERVEACSWTFDGRLLPHELPRLRHAMRRSWKRRSKLWLEGGRGYWVEGGEK